VGTILVVEDDSFFRVFFSDLLEAEGYSVDTASSGQEALRMVKNRDYHVVITDLVLQDIGGDQAEAQAHFPLWLLVPAPEGSRLPSLGFGFFARGYSEFLALPGASGVPTATYNISQQYTGIATAAYSWSNLASLLPGKLSAGASLKIDNQRLSRASGSMLLMSDSNNDVDFLSATVVGLDVGGLYDINQNFRVGATVFDMVSGDFTFEGDDTPEPFDVLFNGDVGKVDPSLVVGGAFKTETWYGPLQGVLVSMDIAEPFDKNQAFWKNVYIGAESKMSFVSTRVGFFQGYLGGGVGIGPLQYAFFGTEAGNYPGARSNYQHALSFAFAFGL